MRLDELVRHDTISHCRRLCRIALACLLNCTMWISSQRKKVSSPCSCLDVEPLLIPFRVGWLRYQRIRRRLFLLILIQGGVWFHIAWSTCYMRCKVASCKRRYFGQPVACPPALFAVDGEPVEMDTLWLCAPHMVVGNYQ